MHQLSSTFCHRSLTCKTGKHTQTHTRARVLHACMSCRYSCAHRARGKCVHIFYHRPTQLRHHIAPNRCWSPDRDRPVGRPSSSHGKTRFVVHTYGGGDQMHRRQDKRARVQSPINIMFRTPPRLCLLILCRAFLVRQQKQSA